MNLFLAAYFVGVFVYAVAQFNTLRVSRARRACGVYQNLDRIYEMLEERGLMSLVFVLGALLFPLSLAHDVMLNEERVKELKRASAKVEKAERDLEEARRNLGEASEELRQLGWQMLKCGCGREQPMYIGEGDSGGLNRSTLEECGWTLEPVCCPYCNEKSRMT